MTKRSLKSLNMKWLAALAAADAAILLLLEAPEALFEFALSQGIVSRAPAVFAILLVVLLVVHLLPHNMKATIVFWRLRHALPGCRVFTIHGPKDQRIDMGALEKSIGTLPADPGRQNREWYRLYRLVQEEPMVSDAHRHYLLYRDMAAMSLMLALLVPAPLAFLDAALSTVWTGVGLFVVQYVATAVSARACGIRLACHVLAIHSART